MCASAAAVARLLLLFERGAAPRPIDHWEDE